MGCQVRGENRVVHAAQTQVEQVVEPKVPVVDAATIRENVKSLARDKADADKVLDTLSASTPTASLGYEGAHKLDYEHGLNRQFAPGQQIHDYYRDVKGELHLDFSKTQDASYRTEQAVYQTRGPLGRVHQQVVNQTVQTLRSEKVRLDCDLSPKLAIDLGQSDTVFVSAAHQKGDKQIALSQKDGGGSLGIVVGKDQKLLGVTFDATKQVATVTTDKGTITVTGISNPNDVRIGREKGTGASPAFVAIDAIAATSREGRKENLAADTQRVKELVTQGGAIVSKVKEQLSETAKTVAQYALTAAPQFKQGSGEQLSPNRVVEPVTPPTPPAPTPPAASPSDRPVEAPKPEALAKVEELIKKNEEAAAQLQQKLEQADLAQREAEARIQKANERIALAELKDNVNDILAARGEKPARSADITTTRDALPVDPSKEAPGAEAIAKALVESRGAARAQVEMKVRDSMQSITSESSLKQVKEWADKNMTLFGTLNEDGRKAFADQIKRDWQYGAGRESFEPQEFFDSRLAFTASREIKSATRAVTTYMPPSSRPGPFTPVTHHVPDIAQISEVVRTLQDKPKVRSLLAATPEYKAARDAFNPGWFSKGPSEEQRSLDARMDGNAPLAETLLVRCLIKERRVFTKNDRAVIAEAVKTDPDRINNLYKVYYETSIRDELKSLNGAALGRAERTKKELEERQRIDREAREGVADLLD